MTLLNFTINSEVIKKFLSEKTKNEGIRILNELFLNNLLKNQSDEVKSWSLFKIFVIKEKWSRRQPFAD